jgi:hypothetical protein
MNAISTGENNEQYSSSHCVQLKRVVLWTRSCMFQESYRLTAVSGVYNHNVALPSTESFGRQLQRQVFFVLFHSKQFSFLAKIALQPLIAKRKNIGSPFMSLKNR